jgi:predicted aminopeptidase
LTHNRYYAPGAAEFNESFANFVGARGAAAFFKARGDSANAARCERRWDDTKRLGAFWMRVKDSLETAWAAHPGATGRQARLDARDRVYAWARRYLVDSVGPQLATFPAGYAARVRLDNASLLSRRVYLTDLDRFDAVWEREGRDLRRAIERVIAERNSRQGAGARAR